jgi:ribosomal protein S18 acetylase RimI-like enzyme
VSWALSDRPALGTTVTLQVSTPVGPIGVVGTLIDADPDTWSVRRRDGSVSVINVSAIVAGRVVPPSRAARASVAEVERMAALGWRGSDLQPLGEWLLRAGGGFTSRANSALVVGDPGMAPEAALDAVEQWYATRGLPPRIQLPDQATPPGLTEALDRRGWAVSPGVHVMTAELGHVLRAATASTELELRIDKAPDAGWLGCYRQDGGTLPPVAREVLTNHPGAVFASFRRGERAVAIARAAVDDRWAGLFAVEVAPDHRRLGLGGLVSAAALRWAGQRGARRTYLQASADNLPAIALYERLGYATHHDYVYRYPSPQRSSCISDQISIG